MAYKLRIKYGSTTIADNISLSSAATKNLLTNNKYLNGNLIIEVYNDAAASINPNLIENNKDN